MFQELVIKEELFSFYYSFLKNPEEERKKAVLLQEKYDGLLSYSEHASKKIISSEIKQALEGLSTVEQYGMFEEDHPAFSNKKILEQAKKIKNMLKNETSNNS